MELGFSQDKLLAPNSTLLIQLLTTKRSLKELSSSKIVFLRKIIWNFLQEFVSGKF